MINLLPHLFALAAPLVFLQGTAPDPALSAENRAAVRCSAVFAIVAGEQQRGAMQGYPPLGWRGREYMVLTGAALIDAGWNKEQVAAAMRDAAASLQAEAIKDGDADGVLAKVMPPCLSLLDAEVEPLIEPNLPQLEGIVWPLLGAESEEDEPPPLEQIREVLREVGVSEMRIWPELSEPEFCEDCGAPLYPNGKGEIVHAEMPGDVEPESSHFH